MRWPGRFLHRVPLTLFTVAGLLVIFLFLAPATLDEGEVTGLDGGANMMDHWDKWSGMDPFHMIIYTFGDINCHQMEERTIIVNGNQMPVCARDVGIFIGMGFGSLLLVRASARDSPLDSGLSILPSRFTKGKSNFFKFLLGLSFMGILLFPTALDGGMQMLSGMNLLPGNFTYESSNPLRLITGFPTGIAVGLIYSSLLMALFSRRDDGSPSLISLRS